jgi:hypothetical protein
MRHKIHFALRPSLLAGSAVILLASACSDPFSLGPANILNRVDTTFMFALSNSAVGVPSAYDMVIRSNAVTELGQNFDFVFDFREDGSAVLSPRGALGLAVSAGLQVVDDTFDEITSPPSSGYVTDESTVIQVGDVLVGRSRASSSGCSFLGSIARFGKFRVLSLDVGTGEVRLELLVNANCAFRNLEPGIPTN